MKLKELKVGYIYWYLSGMNEPIEDILTSIEDGGSNLTDPNPSGKVAMFDTIPRSTKDVFPTKLEAIKNATP